MEDHRPRRVTLMMAVGRLHRIWEEYLRGVAQALGIPEAYTKTVLYIDRHPGASQTQIAALGGVTAAAVNQTVKELCRDGYVRKEVDERDKRHTRLYVTEKGASIAGAVRGAFGEADGRITAFLTEERERELTETLNAVGDLIKGEADA